MRLPVPPLRLVEISPLHPLLHPAHPKLAKTSLFVSPVAWNLISPALPKPAETGLGPVGQFPSPLRIFKYSPGRVKPSPAGNRSRHGVTVASIREFKTLGVSSAGVLLSMGLVPYPRGMGMDYLRPCRHLQASLGHPQAPAGYQCRCDRALVFGSDIVPVVFHFELDTEATG